MGSSDDWPAAAAAGPRVSFRTSKRSALDEALARGRAAPGAPEAQEKHPCMIHPRHATKRYWDGYILVLVLYTVTVELFNTSMGDGHMMMMGEQSHDTPTDWLVDISYGIDIVLHFFTGFDEDGKGSHFVMVPRKSAARYVTGWFIVDVLSTFPYAAFEETKGHVISLFRLLRTTRLVRVLRAGGNAREIFDAAVARFQIRAAYLDIIRLVVGILFAIHFLGCLFHLLGVLEQHGKIEDLLGSPVVSQYGADKASNWLEQYNIADKFATGADAQEAKASREACLDECAVGCAEAVGEIKIPRLTKYLWSTYWAITTVTTIGYGDITPVTNAELFFVCIAELLGMFMFVYTANVVASLIRGLGAKRDLFQAHLDRLHEYMQLRDIPPDLQKRVVQYLTFINSPRCQTEQDEDELLRPLTQTLREELRQASYVPWLTRNHTFRRLLEETGGQFSDRHHYLRFDAFFHPCPSASC